MTAESYVEQIVKKVWCDKTRRQDISRQLLAEIQERMSGGETLENIIEEMGDIREIAEGFNETLSEKDKKKYRHKRLLIIAVCVALVLMLLAAGVKWMLPSVRDLESSAVFSKTEVESTLKEVITLLDEGDFSALQTMATEQMAPALQEHTFRDAKAKLCDDFGDRIGFGTIYSNEVVQLNRHWAVCQINVSYENTSITYTITFDDNMKIAGLYMK